MSATAAETLPSNVTACVSEIDALQRLACFDREIARYYQPKPGPVATQPATNVHVGAGTVTSSSDPTPPGLSNAASVTPAGTPSPPQHLSAHIISIKRHADDIVFNLDNGQSWQTSEAAPVSIDLRVGDVVSIDKSWGSFWLTGRAGEGLQVREEKKAAGGP